MTIQTYLEKAGHSMHLIPIGTEEGAYILSNFGKRIVCWENGNKIHCALQRSKNVGYYIAVGKSTREKIQANYQDKLEVIIEKDESEYKMEVPEEFLEVLATDPEAKEYFEQLTEGKQRSLIHLIAKAKHSNTRINRALKIAEKLKWGITDLKELTRS